MTPSHFSVGRQELLEAWRIFTPLLDEIDSTQPQPVLYPFGSRAPPGFEEFASEHGVQLGAFLLDPTLVTQRPRRPRHGSVAWQKPIERAPVSQPVTPEPIDRAAAELPDSGSKADKCQAQAPTAHKWKGDLKQVPVLDDLKHVAEAPTPLRRRLQYHATM